jgi:hypothetical protein
MTGSDLDTLLESKHRVPTGLVKTLDRGSIALLVEIVSGRADHPRRERACGVLVAADPARAVDPLRQLLRNESEGLNLRVAAAAALGHARIPEAEKALLEAISTARPVVLRARVASSLCKIGTDNSRGTFQELTADPEESVRRLGHFGLVLIAHRMGRDGFRPPHDAGLPNLPPGTGVTKCVPSEPPRALVQEVLPSLRDDTYGVRIGERGTFGIDCDEYWLLCLDEEYFREGFHRRLTRAPSLVGLLARRSPSDGSFSTSRVILGGPSDSPSSFYIAAFRTDGNLSHSGTGTVANDRASFELFSTAAETLTVQVRGTLSQGNLTFEAAVYSQRDRHQRTPVPLKWDSGFPGEAK